MQASKAPGNKVTAVAAVAATNSSNAVKQQEVAPLSLAECVKAVLKTTKAITSRGGKCRGAACSCAAVPKGIYHLEQRADELQSVSTMVKHEVHTCLIDLAAALLKGGHSERAFRRTTEAFDWLVLSVINDFRPSGHPSGSSSSEDSTSDTHSSTSDTHSSSTSSTSSSNASSHSDSAARHELDALREQVVNLVAVTITNSGLLGHLLLHLQKLQKGWETTHGISVMGNAREPFNTPVCRTMLDSVLKAHTLLDRTQEMYLWATALTDLWPGGPLSDANVESVVTAAAEVAAWHLQHMADISRINKLLVEQGRRKLPYPCLAGVAAAVEHAKSYLDLFSKCLPQHNPQQQQQQQQQQRSQNPTAGSNTVQLPADVEHILHDSYRCLLPLCATVLVFDGLQLHHLVRLEQEREQQLQQQVERWRHKQQQQGEVPAIETAAAEADSVVGAVAAGSVTWPDAAGMATVGAATAEGVSAAAVAAPPQAGSSNSSSLTAAPSAACSSCSRSRSNCTCSKAASAAAAAALAAEQALLLSASRLQLEVPDWLSAIPGWGVLLEGAWGDMGYPTELQDEINDWGLDDGESSSCGGSGSSAGSVLTAGRSISTNSSRSRARSGSRGSSNRGSSVCRHAARVTEAYGHCVDICIDRWSAMLAIMLYPLRETDNQEALEILKNLTEGGFAATHVAQLPVVLLAIAHAAVDRQATGMLQLVATAAEAVGHVCGNCQLSWGLAAGLQQQGVQQQQQPKQQQPKQQQDLQQQGQGELQPEGELQQQHQRQDEQQQGVQQQPKQQHDQQQQPGQQHQQQHLHLLQQEVQQQESAEQQQQKGGQPQQQLVKQQQPDRPQQQQPSSKQQQQPDAQQPREASWQVAGLVVLLLQQLLTQAATQQQQQQQQQQQGVQQQQQQQPGALAAPAASTAVSVQHTPAGLCVAIQQCLAVLALLLTSRVKVNIHSLGECQRMAHVLQVTEAGVRCMAALQIPLTSSSSSAAGGAVAAAGAAGKAAGAASTATATAAAAMTVCPDTSSPIQAIVWMCAKVLTDLQDSEQHMLRRAERKNTPSRVRQHQQAYQRTLLVCEAALSLLLTVSKLPHSMESAEVCAGFASVYKALSVAVGPMRTLQQADSRRGATGLLGPDQLYSAPAYELWRAASVLAGRYLMLLGVHMQQLAAVADIDALKWLVAALLGTDAVIDEDGSAESDYKASGPLGEVVGLAVLHGPSKECYPDFTSSVYLSGLRHCWEMVQDKTWALGSEIEAEMQQALRNADGAQACICTLDALLVLQQPLAAKLKEWYKGYKKCAAALQEIECRTQEVQAEVVEQQRQRRQLTAKQRLALKLAEGRLQSWQKAEQECRSVMKMPADGFFPLMVFYAGCLVQIGATMCAVLPTRFCCNNPRCSSMATASEGFLLVRGQSCVCGGCLMGSRRPVLAPTFCTAARYCSRECQAADWGAHQHTCRHLRQAAAAAAAAGTASCSQSLLPATAAGAAKGTAGAAAAAAGSTTAAEADAPAGDIDSSRQ